MNKVMLIGRLGKDPEVRYMANGDAVANITLATAEKWKDKSGTMQERTEWHTLVMYKRSAEIAGQYLAKGSQIYVEGKIQTRKWQDKEGKDRYSTEIVVQSFEMLGTKATVGSGDKPASQQDLEQMSPSAADNASLPSGIFDDDVPF